MMLAVCCRRRTWKGWSSLAWGDFGSATWSMAMDYSHSLTRWNPDSWDGDSMHSSGGLA